MDEPNVDSHDPDPRLPRLDPSNNEASATAGASRHPRRQRSTPCRRSFTAGLLFLVLLVGTLFSHAALPANATDVPFKANAVFSDRDSAQYDRQVDVPRSAVAPTGSSATLNSLLNASDRNGLDLATIDRLVDELNVARNAWTSTGTVDHGQVTLTKRAEPEASTCACGEKKLSTGQRVGYGLLIPILVILSGIFAGLTLGYMSLDETQLQVLSLQGTPKQKEYAEKIMPIRKDGHLLLTTLLIANMITNETLPIIADPLFGGGVQAVIGSIAMVVVCAELIPQSICSRYGLAIGAKMAPITRVVIFILWPIAYPVSRVLHWTLGPHHGIVYRRAELKELVNMHAATSGRGDLNNDTVTIVGGALDLQEKVVKQAMTPIDRVFMIPLDAKLDYPTLQEIVGSGHSRIPVYHEIEIPVGTTRSGTATPSKTGGFLSGLSRKTSASTAVGPNASGNTNDEKTSQDTEVVMTTIKKKKIIGTLLVKQCVLLDPEDSVPVKDMVINAVPTVPADEPLLNLLNVFQEGRSHLAIVSSRTRRGSPGSFLTLGENGSAGGKGGIQRAPTAARIEDLGAIDEEKQLSREQIKGSRWSRHLRRALHRDASDDVVPELADGSIDVGHVATEMAQRDVPIGIITLEDVLEELIGEEILDEYDSEVEQNFAKLSPPPSPDQKAERTPHALVEKVKEDDFVLPTPSLQTPAAAAPRSLSSGGGGGGGGGVGAGMLQRFKISRNNSVKDAPAYFDRAPEPSSSSGVPVAAGIPADATTPAQDVKAEQADTIPSPDPVTQKVRIADPPASNDEKPSARSSMTSTSRREGDATSTATAATATPRTGLPVIIRHQPADGPPATAIVSESLLRGRSAGPEGQERSRSSTPSGQSRAKIFKSSPLVAVPSQGGPPRRRGMSRDTSGPETRQGSLLAHSSTATAPSTPVVVDSSQTTMTEEPEEVDSLRPPTEKKDEK